MSSRFSIPFTVQPWDDVPYWLEKPVETGRGISLDPFQTTNFAYERERGTLDDDDSFETHPPRRETHSSSSS